MKECKSIIESLYKLVIRAVLAIGFAVSIISISTLLILNSTWLYDIAINKYNLVKVTGLSSQALIENYKGLIAYLQNIFIEKLMFKDFSMSKYGEIHFKEVKAIFIYLIIITVIFMLGIIIYLVLSRNKFRGKEKLLKAFNDSANVLIGFFCTIAVAYFVDFSWAFTVFHKIFFRNDYWIFDPKLDPVINALPEEFFMICAAAILVLLVIAIVIIKVLYKRRNRIVFEENTTLGI